MIVEDAPPPPDSNRWVDVLHWLARVLSTDSSDLGFVASLLAQAIERPGLTPRQAKYAQKIFDRVCVEWRQQSTFHPIQPSWNLATMVPEGRA